MPKIEFQYRGRKVAVDHDDKKAAVTIDDRYEIACTLMATQVPIWACSNAYSMAPDPKSLAKQLVDHIDVLTAPTTCPVPGIKTLKGGKGAKGSKGK